MTNIQNHTKLIQIDGIRIISCLLDKWKALIGSGYAGDNLDCSNFFHTSPCFAFHRRILLMHEVWTVLYHSLECILSVNLDEDSAMTKHYTKFVSIHRCIIFQTPILTRFIFSTMALIIQSISYQNHIPNWHSHPLNTSTTFMTQKFTDGPSVSLKSVSCTNCVSSASPHWHSCCKDQWSAAEQVGKGGYVHIHKGPITNESEHSYEQEYQQQAADYRPHACMIVQQSFAFGYMHWLYFGTVSSLEVERGVSKVIPVSSE